MPLIAVSLQTAAKELELPPPAPGTPGPLSLGDAAAVESRLREASASDHARFMRAIAAPINNLLADQPKERREEVWSAIARATEAYASDQGNVSLPGEVTNVVGRR